jgi:putative ABC transport system permease protein
MAEAYDISFFSMILCFLLLLIPMVISHFLRLNLLRSILSSVSRMTFQLAFIGIFLTFLFDINNSLINLVWVLVMLMFAAHAVIQSSGIRLNETFLPFTISLAVTNIPVLFYFNSFVVDLPSVFEARYLIPVAGMILGNSLKSNVVGVSDFCSNLQRNEHRYLYRLSVGAGKYEAVVPYLRKSIISALRPTIANMATVGIVFLPGMMTGQILGGSSPIVAIEYQVAIMIVIFVTTAMSVVLCVVMIIERGFDEYGIFRKELLVEE